jgi:hypothetical protein
LSRSHESTLKRRSSINFSDFEEPLLCLTLVLLFEIPEVTEVPTVAETAEAGTPSRQIKTSPILTVNVKKYAGQQTFSVELLEQKFASVLCRVSYAEWNSLARNANKRSSKRELLSNWRNRWRKRTSLSC